MTDILKSTETKNVRHVFKPESSLIFVKSIKKGNFKKISLSKSKTIFPFGPFVSQIDENLVRLSHYRTLLHARADKFNMKEKNLKLLSCHVVVHSEPLEKSSKMLWHLFLRVIRKRENKCGLRRTRRN